MLPAFYLIQFFEEKKIQELLMHRPAQCEHTRALKASLFLSLCDYVWYCIEQEKQNLGMGFQSHIYSLSLPMKALSFECEI